MSNQYIYIYFRKIEFWYNNFKSSNYFCSQVSKAEASEAGLIGGLGHRNQDLTKLQLKRHRRLARTKEHVLETPLDLELDLAAQKTKLDLLQSDISRLRDIQCKLQEAQLAGQLDDEERASWLQDHEYLEGLLSKVISKIRGKIKNKNVLSIFKKKQIECNMTKGYNQGLRIFFCSCLKEPLV